jgi:hypothetical protein
MTAEYDTTSASIEFREIPGHRGYRVAPGCDDFPGGRVESGWVKGGRFRGMPVGPWKSMTLTPNVKNGGHLQVSLYGGGLINTGKVHQLILEAFVGPCPPGMECRHKDGNPTNNRLENLAWGTRTENIADRVAHGTSNRGERSGKAKLTESQVIEIRRLRSMGMVCREIGLMYGVHPSTISGIVLRYKWRHI